jgi:hypothetical protein
MMKIDSVPFLNNRMMTSQPFMKEDNMATKDGITYTSDEKLVSTISIVLPHGVE